MKKIAFMLPCLLMVLIGCNKIEKELKDTRAEFARQMEETRTAVKEISYAAIKSVPGERYLQLIDDLNSRDETKRTAAQQFLKSLAGIDPKIDYKVSVWFVYDTTTTGPMRADFFLGHTPYQSNVEWYIKQKKMNLSDVASSDDRPFTEEELKSYMDSQIKKFIAETEIVQDSPEWSTARAKASTTVVKGYRERIVTGPDDNPRAKDHVIREPIYETKTDIGAKAYLGVDLLAQKGVTDYLRNAILSGSKHSYIPPYNRAGALQCDFNVLSSATYLFVLLNKEDWTQHKKDNGGKGIMVRCLVHKADNPDIPINGTRVYTFSMEEIEANAPISLEGTTVMWACHNMVKDLELSEEGLEAQKRLLDIIGKWDSGPAQ
ncbi:hypothetical protein [Desulfatitalea tepidiphila]|uniref:hypothetical protein n=1 Tax=Desulfatitalea tepidiphila TaxID=1185843 RepID=UPI0006B5FB51|nr:hypothetical protein [Desulfatitalea tepidiphila]